MKIFQSLMYFILHKMRYCLSTQQIPQGIYLVVGLGNPGKAMESTRHNVGQQFIRYLSKQLNAPLQNGNRIYFQNKIIDGMIGNYKNVILFNPVSFMNLSGSPIKKVALSKQIPTQNIIIVHDDLDSHVGKCKIKVGGSAEGHNGLKSIISALDANFLRLKIGIGRPNSKDPEIVSDYVLSKGDYQQTQESFSKGLVLLQQQLKF